MQGKQLKNVMRFQKGGKHMVYDWEGRNTWSRGALLLGIGVALALGGAGFLYLPDLL